MKKVKKVKTLVNFAEYLEVDSHTYVTKDGGKRKFNIIL